jgi:hypothetical protein
MPIQHVLLQDCDGNDIAEFNVHYNDDNLNKSKITVRDGIQGAFYDRTNIENTGYYGFISSNRSQSYSLEKHAQWLLDRMSNYTGEACISRDLIILTLQIYHRHMIQQTNLQEATQDWTLDVDFHSWCDQIRKTNLLCSSYRPLVVSAILLVHKLQEKAGVAPQAYELFVISHYVTVKNYYKRKFLRKWLNDKEQTPLHVIILSFFLEKWLYEVLVETLQFKSSIETRMAFIYDPTEEMNAHMSLKRKVHHIEFNACTIEWTEINGQDVEERDIKRFKLDPDQLTDYTIRIPTIITDTAYVFRNGVLDHEVKCPKHGNPVAIIEYAGVTR